MSYQHKINILEFLGNIEFTEVWASAIEYARIQVLFVVFYRLNMFFIIRIYVLYPNQQIHNEKILVFKPLTANARASMNSTGEENVTDISRKHFQEFFIYPY